MPHRLRILHLSDLHERVALDWMPADRKRKIAVTEASRVRVLEDANLCDVLKSLRTNGGEIDLLCFTGDIADWGLEAEYAAATTRIRKLVDACSVREDRVFVVPGNHDIVRTVETPAWEAMRRLAAVQPEAVSHWMAGLEAPSGADPSLRDAIVARSQAFWNWVDAALKRGTLRPARHGHGLLGYRETLQLPRLPFPVHVVGLDTAWLAGNEYDKGQLRLTSHQIDMLARGQHGSKLDGFRIALMHHGLSDLADERSAIGLLAPTVDILLHGHQHSAVNEVRADPDRSLRVFAAGSLYEGDLGDRWINAFQLIDALLDDRGQPLRYDVQFRAWSPNGHWHPSGAMYRAAPQGVLAIEVVAGAHRDNTPPQAPADSSPLVPRTKLFDELRTMVTAGGTRPLALIGMPGVGKSKLAAQISRDEIICKSFDEVFWIALGQEPGLLPASIGRVLKALGDPASVLDASSATLRLKKALEGRTVLLILDDAWRSADLAPFLGAGFAKIVMTTRDAALAESASAIRCPVDPLTPDESLALVTARLGQPLSKGDRGLALQVAEEVGRLPLALAAACARIEDGCSWQALLSELQDEIKRLRALEPPETDEVSPERSVAAAFEISVRALPDDDAWRFAQLALLAEDAVFTPAAAANLWRVAPPMAENTLRRLRRKSMLLDARPEEEQAGEPSYRLHDEQRNAGRRRLGLAQRAAHVQLIATYREASQQLWSIADDGYLHDHLAWHMVEAGLGDQLHTLLAADANGSNAWYVARARRLGGFLDDLRQASLQDSTQPQQLARCVLVASSIASLGFNLPHPLLRELLSRGIWSAEQAWGHVLSLPPSQRAPALGILLPLVGGTYRHRCVRAALDNIRACKEEHVAYLFEHIPLRSITPEEADRLLAVAQAIEPDPVPSIVMALGHFAVADRHAELVEELVRLGTDRETPSRVCSTGLLSLLPLGVVQQLLGLYADNEEFRAQASVRLAQLGDVDGAMAAMRSIETAVRQCRAIRGIAPHVPPELLDELVSLANNHQDAGADGLAALGAIYSRYEQPRQAALIDDLWRRADSRDKGPLIPYLPIENIRRIGRLPDGDDDRLGMVRRMVNLGLSEQAQALISERSRASSELEIIAPTLGEAQLLRLGVIDAGTDPWTRGALIPQWFALGHRHEAAALLAGVADQPHVFSKILDRTASTLDDEALLAVLATCQRVGDDRSAKRFMASLGVAEPAELRPNLSLFAIEGLFDIAEIHAVALRMAPAVAEAFRALLGSPAARLAVTAAQPLLAKRFAVEDIEAVADLVDSAVVDRPDEPFEKTLARLQLAVHAADHVAATLSACDPDEQQHVAANASRVARHVGLYEPRLLVMLYGGQAVFDLVSDRTHLHQLLDLAPVLDGHLRTKIEQRVNVQVESEHPYQVISKLSDARMLTPALLDLAIDASRRLDTEIGVSGGNLVEHCCKANRMADALAVMSLIPERYGGSRLSCHAALAAHAPAPLSASSLDQVWQMVFREDFTLRNQNDSDEIAKVIGVAMLQPEKVRSAMWSHACHGLMRSRRQHTFDYLAAMTPLLYSLGGREAILEAANAAADVTRWWP